MSFRPALLLTVLLAGCATADQVDQLTTRIDELEKKVVELEKAPARGGAPTAADSAKETAANEVLKGVAEAMKAGDYTAAKTQLAAMEKDYGDTLAFRKAAKMKAELDVIGKDAPLTWNIEKWFQGQNDIALDGTGTTLVVFWEVWCPHCQREVPNLQAMYEKLHPQGLKVVGLTKITKSATEQGVTDFLKEKNVTYPIAKEDGSLSEHFGVSGIPAAAVVKDGKVIWRGHPARLDEETLKQWL